MKVVLDTNGLLVSIPTKSVYRPIFDAIIGKKLQLVVTQDILNEYEEIIGKMASSAVARNIMGLLDVLDNVAIKRIYFKWDLIKEDRDDNKFTDCAIAANVDYLISNDKHFAVLRKIEFPRVNLISIEEFLKIVKNRF